MFLTEEAVSHDCTHLVESSSEHLRCWGGCLLLGAGRLDGGGFHRLQGVRGGGGKWMGGSEWSRAADRRATLRRQGGGVQQPETAWLHHRSKLATPTRRWRSCRGPREVLLHHVPLLLHPPEDRAVVLSGVHGVGGGVWLVSHLGNDCCLNLPF